MAFSLQINIIMSDLVQYFRQLLRESLSESNLDNFSKDIDHHYKRSTTNSSEHTTHDNSVSFEVGHREGKMRLKNIKAHVPNKGHATKVLKHLTGLADKHKVEMELTASPHGDESTRLNHDQLHHFYSKHGFEMEPGYDPAYGYMIRKSK